VESSGDLVSNRDAAARKRQHNDIRASGVPPQPIGQDATGVVAIVKPASVSNGRANTHVGTFRCEQG
jgi:hypothetical protein